MKDYLKKVELIRNKLAKGGFEDLSERIFEAQSSCGTLGESFAGVAFILNQIKKESQGAYFHAIDEIDEIINYAKSINYLQG